MNVPIITTEQYIAARRELAMHQYYERHGRQPDVIIDVNPKSTRRSKKWLLGPAVEKVEA
jgi:hypothetical protein